MGSEAEQKLAMKGLSTPRASFSRCVAERLQTRFTPVLTFKRDESVKKSIAMSRLIDETLLADRQANRGRGSRVLAPIDANCERTAADRAAVRSEHERRFSRYLPLAS